MFKPFNVIHRFIGPDVEQLSFRVRDCESGIFCKNKKRLDILLPGCEV